LSAVMLRCERALASEPANGLHYKSPVGGNRLIYRLPFLREGSHFIPEIWVTQSGLLRESKSETARRTRATLSKLAVGRHEVTPRQARI
jgi:hypothetical protein